MREIKFRAWSKRHQKMTQAMVLKLSLYGQLYEGDPEFNVTDDYILMQFTGLKDIEGKEIYEGDILARKNKECDVVVWDKGAFCVRHKNKSMDFIASPNYFSIVGNVHEHPHLLKERET